MKYFVAVMIVVVVVAGGCCGQNGSADEPKPAPAPVKKPVVASKAKVVVKIVAVKRPAIYTHQFKQTVVIVRDEVGLGLEPNWTSFDKLLAEVFGELKLDQPRTIEFCWVTNPKQDSFVIFRDRKAADDHYVRATIQVAHLTGKQPRECRDLVQSSFVFALYALESGNRNYANLRALIEPRLAYAFDVPRREADRGEQAGQAAE